MVLLEASKKRISAFLNHVRQPVCQVIVKILAHALCENSCKLIQCARKLTIFLSVSLVLIVSNHKLSLFDLDPELFLVDVWLGLECKCQVRQMERTHSPLFYN